LQEITTILESYWQTLLLLLPKLAIVVLVLIIAIFIGSKAGTLVMKGAARRIEDPLLVRFLGTLSKWIFILAGILLCMLILGLGGIAGGMLAGAGISALILGFAFKDIGENFLAGIILAFSRPYGIGDWVETGDTVGIVKSLDLRNTHIKTFDGKDVYMPNAIVIKTPLINYTRDGFLRYEFVVGIDIIDAVSEVNGVLGGEHAPEVYVDSLGVSTINLKVYFWVDTFDERKTNLQILGDVMNWTKKVLLEHKITLPADITELKIYNEELPIPIRLIRSKPGERDEGK
jgi:small conductance mechanosensitive channel